MKGVTLAILAAVLSVAVVGACALRPVKRVTWVSTTRREELRRKHEAKGKQRQALMHRQQDSA